MFRVNRSQFACGIYPPETQSVCSDGRLCFFAFPSWYHSLVRRASSDLSCGQAKTLVFLLHNSQDEGYHRSKSCQTHTDRKHSDRTTSSCCNYCHRTPPKSKQKQAESCIRRQPPKRTAAGVQRADEDVIAHEQSRLTKLNLPIWCRMKPMMST